MDISSAPFALCPPGLLVSRAAAWIFPGHIAPDILEAQSRQRKHGQPVSALRRQPWFPLNSMILVAQNLTAICAALLAVLLLPLDLEIVLLPLDELTPPGASTPRAIAPVTAFQTSPLHRKPREPLSRTMAAAHPSGQEDGEDGPKPGIGVPSTCQLADSAGRLQLSNKSMGVKFKWAPSGGHHLGWGFTPTNHSRGLPPYNSWPQRKLDNTLVFTSWILPTPSRAKHIQSNPCHSNAKHKRAPNATRWPFGGLPQPHQEGVEAHAALQRNPGGLQPSNAFSWRLLAGGQKSGNPQMEPW